MTLLLALLWLASAAPGTTAAERGRQAAEAEVTTATVFGIGGQGNTFAFVFDRSGSMSEYEGRPLAAVNLGLTGWTVTSWSCSAERCSYSFSTCSLAVDCDHDYEYEQEHGQGTARPRQSEIDGAWSQIVRPRRIRPCRTSPSPLQNHWLGRAPVRA
jgi:hypothetical protein